MRRIRSPRANADISFWFPARAKAVMLRVVDPSVVGSVDTDVRTWLFDEVQRPDLQDSFLRMGITSRVRLELYATACEWRWQRP